MPNRNPDHWTCHKAALFELAAKIGAEIGQDANSKPTIRHPPSATAHSFPTWLAALSWLRQIAKDQQPKTNAHLQPVAAPPNSQTGKEFTPLPPGQEEVPYALPYIPPVPHTRAVEILPHEAKASDGLIRFHCPACHKRIKTTTGTAGRSGTCPHCHEPLIVPRFTQQNAQ